MRKRGTFDRPFGESGHVGCTVIASWLPWKYWLVSTVYSNPAENPFREAYKSLSMPVPNVYITQIFRCDAIGFARNMDEVYYEKEYASLQQAQAGHNETVEKLFHGRLRLRKVR